MTEGATTSTTPLLMQPRTRVWGFDQPLEAASGSSWSSTWRTSSASTCTYGEHASGRLIVTNLRLPGQYDERLLGPLGLQGPYYNWNRWYLPGVGRYLEPDPLALRGGWNAEWGPDWYNYGEGNPLTHTDPTGEFLKLEGCPGCEDTCCCSEMKNPGSCPGGAPTKPNPDTCDGPKPKPAPRPKPAPKPEPQPQPNPITTCTLIGSGGKGPKPGATQRCSYLCETPGQGSFHIDVYFEECPDIIHL